VHPQPDPLPTTEGDASAVPENVRACVTSLRRAAGEELLGVIFFGSQLLRTSPDRHSAADLFVLVEDHRALYVGLREQALVRRRPGLLRALNQLLSPNVLWLRQKGDDGPGCKCFVMLLDDFEHAMSSRARDHFCKGRLTQQVKIVFSKDEATSTRIGRSLELARRDSLGWVPSYLPLSFTVADYCLRMLEVSFANEIRPETRDRVRVVCEAQREYLSTAYRAVLEQAGPAMGVARQGDGFVRLSSAVTSPRRMYFRVSRLRATLRWLKYMLTYEDWLDYVVHKVHRRTGLELTISNAERRLPLLLLWPKFFRVLGALRETPRVDHKPEFRA
jgi:hypothetical protein